MFEAKITGIISYKTVNKIKICVLGISLQVRKIHILYKISNTIYIYIYIYMNVQITVDVYNHGEC
jgi:hypothetical protein